MRTTLELRNPFPFIVSNIQWAIQIKWWRNNHELELFGHYFYGNTKLETPVPVRALILTWAMISPWMGDHSSDKVDAVVKNRVKSQEWRNGGPPMKNSWGHFLYLLPNALLYFANFFYFVWFLKWLKLCVTVLLLLFQNTGLARSLQYNKCGVSDVHCHRVLLGSLRGKRH